MQSSHALLIGRSGSGKTTLAKVLLSLSARFIVLDTEHEYEIPGAYVAYDLDEAIDIFVAKRRGEFGLVYRPESIEDYWSLLELVSHSQTVEPLGPIVLLTEEASRLSDTHSIPEPFRELYNRGRHKRISLLTVAQLDTDIHRITRRNSRIIVSCAQTSMSTDFQRYFSMPQVQRLRGLDTEWQSGRQITMPVQGVHFLTYPPQIDLYKAWGETHGYITESE